MYSMYSIFGCSDVNERLSTAVHNGNYEDALSCLMQGAKATSISYSCGRTAVGSAALMGDPEILQLLIQSCEEPDLEIFRPDSSNNTEQEIDTTPDGMDCLEWEDEFTADTDEMNNSADTTDETIEEFTSLYNYYAKTFERTGDIVSSLENYGYEHNCNKILHQDCHTMDHMSMAPLHYAAFRGDVQCARILLEHGAKVDTTTSVGYTPLHIGADNCDITLLLLKYGANPNAKTFSTWETPFNAALKYRNAKVLNILLQTNKININEIDENDKTPLMYAITYDQLDAAMELIRRGARINLQDKDGKTALFYAVEKKNIILASRLLERGARHITSHYLLHQCVVNDDMKDMLKLLLSHDERLNSLKVRNPDGFTPIQLAIIYKKAELLEYMLKLDSSSLQLDIDNDVILAVQYIDQLNEFKCIFKILLAYGNCFVWKSSTNMMPSSIVNCYVPFCHTPLSRAIMLNKLPIAEYLIKEGIGLHQICYKHVVNNLRTLTTTGCYEFTKFLVLNGFNFPQQKILNTSSKWSKERQEFEENVMQLTQQPLKLKSLTRIGIRKHLIQTFCNSTVEFKQKFRATNDKSTLKQMIEQLEIPKSLETFLIDFNDCETVMP